MSSMQLFYVQDNKIAGFLRFNSGSKARNDLTKIFQQFSMIPITLPPVDTYDHQYHNILSKKLRILRKIRNSVTVGHAWKYALRVTEPATVVLQYPPNIPSLFLPNILKRQKNDGFKVIIFIHDLLSVRVKKTDPFSVLAQLRRAYWERTLLQVSDVVIAHNAQMGDLLVNDFGISPSKIVCLDMFDYLLPPAQGTANRRIDLPIVVAGNLSPHKAGYLSRLPNDIEFNLYGAEYTGSESSTVHYKGAFPPDDLPNEIEGSFGLVWDGPDSSTCSGDFGSYLRINNPHKTSLYLASELPVLVWSGAAIADFIVSHGLGITVDALDDIPQKLSSMSIQDYDLMLQHVTAFAPKLRTGGMTKDALRKAATLLGQQNLQSS